MNDVEIDAATAAQPADAPPVVDRQLVALARTPAEMRVAQASLIAWVRDKVEREKAEAAELRENYVIAQRAKWRSGLLKRHADRADARVVFFEKIAAALEAGYCIVPDFPMDVFAVRVVRDGPRRFFAHETSKYGAPSVSALADQPTDAPPAGAGENVGVRAVEKVAHGTYSAANDGSVTRWASREAVAFRDVDFPFALARTEIVDAADRAMALKVFDELGVMIGATRVAGPRPERNPDPLVIGRVVLPAKSGMRRYAVAFLVTWHLDVRDLDRIK